MIARRSAIRLLAFGGLGAISAIGARPASADPRAPEESDPGAPRRRLEYVPLPAAAYGLRPSDVDGDFREVAHDMNDDDRVHYRTMIAPEGRLDGGRIWLSDRRVTMVASCVYLTPVGSDVLVARFYDEWRTSLRDRPEVTTEPAIGWGSEQVYSFAAATRGSLCRGIYLKHRNAVAWVVTQGWERFTTWEHISNLMAVVERRIHEAIR